MPSKALPRLIVVIVSVPLCVVGMPAYMYCMLFDLVSVRLALTSILRFFTGSSVMRSCRSSVRLLVAGVATLSFMSSQPRSAALLTYPSSTKPNAKSSPGDITPPLRWPKTSPISGMKPGRYMLYWLR